MNASRHVLFVCSGNTCRSPLAAALLRAHVGAVPDRALTVSSAGTSAWDGSPASEGAYLVALERGMDLGPHRARVLTTEVIRSADLVLTMTAAQAVRAHELGAAARVHTLAAYAMGTERGPDVSDPFGGPLEGYRATLEELEPLIAATWERIQGRLR
ncbi:MAG TPA: low molecular weight protein arginine phosphatase [Gemmatimonadales bacterium]|nr:low molecular weight protein arginine phosphatase [Gemmatimonadales bacterium]